MTELLYRKQFCLGSLLMPSASRIRMEFFKTSDQLTSWLWNSFGVLQDFLTGIPKELSVKIQTPSLFSTRKMDGIFTDRKSRRHKDSLDGFRYCLTARHISTYRHEASKWSITWPSFPTFSNTKTPISVSKK